MKAIAALRTAWRIKRELRHRRLLFPSTSLVHCVPRDQSFSHDFVLMTGDWIRSTFVRAKNFMQNRANEKVDYDHHNFLWEQKKYCCEGIVEWKPKIMSLVSEGLKTVVRQSRHNTEVDKNAARRTADHNRKGKRWGVVVPTKSPLTSLDKRMLVEKDIVDELLLVCGVIGTTNKEGDGLVPVTDCLNWLQDLQRALRRDDDMLRPISLLIGKWKVVQQKLLPLVMTCRYDAPIVLTVVKILVILTKPLAENTKRAGRFVIKASSDDPETILQQNKLRDNALEQSKLLLEYKRLVAHHPSHHQNSKKGQGLLSIFVSLLAEPLSKSGASRTDADHLTIELVLHLFRNLLAAEPLLHTSSDSSKHYTQLHHELITLFEREMVLKILLVLGQDMELRENSQYNLLMMELLNLLLKSHDPMAVAQSGAASPSMASNSGKGRLKPTAQFKGSSLLASKLRQEHNMKRSLSSVRHGNFGGTWMKQQRDGRSHYVGASSKQPVQNRLTQAKRKNRKAEPFVGAGQSLMKYSQRAATESGPATRRARQTLHGFCQRFVKDCYGPVMKSLKNEFRRDSGRLEDGDKAIFFRIIWFFYQWWRFSSHPKSLGQLVITMDVFSFRLVLDAADLFHQHKKHQRSAQTVALYCEMIHMLTHMHASGDKTEKFMSLGLLDRLFFHNEPLDFLPKLISRWEPGTNTREYLCDLVELCHVSLHLLDTAVQQYTEEMKGRDKKDVIDRVGKMKVAVSEFDVKLYFCKKIVSNQLVSMYTFLLGQYRVNAGQVNNYIIAMFARLCKTELAAAEAVDDGDAPVNPLGTRRVTLEPMLYNLHLITVIEQILNDVHVIKDEDFQSMTRFCSDVLFKFWGAAKDNPLIYVECLFRHLTPHRFCESVSNMYVSEELRMIAEREMLLMEQRQSDEATEAYDQEFEVSQSELSQHERAETAGHQLVNSTDANLESPSSVAENVTKSGLDEGGTADAALEAGEVLANETHSTKRKQEESKVEQPESSDDDVEFGQDDEESPIEKSIAKRRRVIDSDEDD